MHIDWFVFFAQIVNFLLLVFLLKKFLYGRIVKAMDERERKVVELRFGLKGEHPRTLAEVSSRFNVSRERIRQIEAKALEQIKAADEIQAMRETA